MRPGLSKGIMEKIRMLSAAVLVCSLFFAGNAYAADRKGSGVEGRVVDRRGRPLEGVKVVAILPPGEYIEDYDRFEAKSGPDGRFLLQGLHPGTYYRIVFDAGQCNDPRERIRSLPTGETLKLGQDYVVIYSPFKVSPEGVIKDLDTGLEWAPVPTITVDYDHAASYAKSLGLAGGGWRLPTVDELTELFESANDGCGLDWAFENRFPRAWSSDPKSPSKRWLVKFYREKVYTELWDKRSAPCDDCRVLPVRFSPKSKLQTSRK